ncbi:MAG: molybdopterin-guanine dinucleotide biosynthesis protein [Thermoleophilia bacterium]|nr:molybdopterin-guanine dinucleotide biosynthesis protein [Thermoleophilia bacterium]
MDLEQCRGLVADAVSRTGAGRPVDALSDEEVAAVLDLARAAAHGVERKAAPLVCFMAGLALAGATPEQRAAALGDAAVAIDAAADRQV